MAQEWFAARELAGLPGMPTTVKGVTGRATAESWRSRARKGRGGGKEYHLTALPQDTQTYLLRLATAEAAATLTAQAAPGTALVAAQSTGLTLAEDRAALSRLADWQRDTASARNFILGLIDDLTAVVGLARAIEQFVAAANGGTHPPEVMAALARANARAGTHGRTVHAGTIRRWLKLRAEGQAALAPGVRAPLAHPAWIPTLLALYQAPQKPTIAECVRDWVTHYPGTPAPALRSAQRHLAALPIEVREWGRMGRNARRAIQPFVRRTCDGLWPMDIVTVDGHMFKGYVVHPLTGGRMRPEVTTYVDYDTRRAIGFSAWLAESSHAIWLALRDMVLNPACGVPAIHYSDNGAYRSEKHRGTLARIGTTPMFAEAYRAQARGVIERLNSSVWVPFARKQDTYCGDDCDQEHLKRALKRADADGANLLTWDGFLAAARATLDAYNAREHASLKGQSPDQAWAAAVADGWVPTLLEADDLHDLLPTVKRTVERGWVRLPWGHYFADSLRAWHKQEVKVGVAPTDGARVWVSDMQGRLICTAMRDGNARPVVHESMLEHARAEREQGRVGRLERKLALVREEGRGLIEVQAAQPVDLVLHAQTVLEMSAPVVETVQVQDGGVAGITDERRLHAYWLRVQARIDAGAPVSDEERRGARVYFASAAAQSMGEFFEVFGLVAGDFA